MASRQRNANYAAFNTTTASTGSATIVVTARATALVAYGAIEQRSQTYQRLRRELLDAERQAVVELWRHGMINDDIMNVVQRDLDLEDARLDV